MQSMESIVQMFETRINERLAKGIITPEQVATLGIVENDMELFAYQTAQSRAFAAGKIPFDAAQWLYRHLGGEFPTKEKFNAQSPAVRAVVTQLIGELILDKKV